MRTQTITRTEDQIAEIALSEPSIEASAAKKPDLIDNMRPAKQSEMRIVACTAFAGRPGNPYNWLLYSNMKAKVSEFTLKSLRHERCDILHFHWPESSLNTHRNPLAAYIRLRLLLFRIDQYTSTGARVVWTAHNLHSHERFHPRLEAWFWPKFLARLHGVIALSASGLDAARRQFPQLTSLPGYVIPHGHYRDEYPNDPELDARSRLAIASSKKVILFFGLIRTYKNIPRLLETFSSIPGEDYALYIAGKPSNQQEIRQISEAAERDPRVQLFLDHVPHDEVQSYFRAADLVVLPFRDILNSGSAILALSFNRPILVPERGAMGELRKLAGPEWVRTYTGELTAEELVRAVDWATAAGRTDKPSLDQLEWPNLAARTLDAYRDICNQDISGV